LPFIADQMAASGRYAAVLCLGAIIRGETTHDQHIARAVGGGIEAIARTWGLPVLFGVLTCDTLAQALARAGGDASSGYAGNKGAECASAAIEMITLLESLPGREAS
jgi:6,7-dimethyl-8-ribityllumazine synthase